MKPVDEHPELLRMLLTLRIIIIFLASGLGGFLLYIHFGLPEPKHPEETTPLLSYVAAGAAVLAFFFFGFMRITIVRQARDLYARREIAGFCARYQTALIIWCSGLEGPGFMAAVTYLQHRDPLSLGVGAAMVLMLLASIPTRGRVNTLLEAVP